MYFLHFPPIFFFFTSNLIESHFCGCMEEASGEELKLCWLAFHLVLLMDAIFFRCKVSSPQLLSCLDFFLYLSTVRLICMFQSSKGFQRRTRTCCLQKVEINVHTFLYV